MARIGGQGGSAAGGQEARLCPARRRWPWWGAVAVVVAVVGGCAALPPTPPTAADPPELLAAWVERVPQAQVRLVLAGPAACPALRVDGRALPTRLRSAAGTAPLRPPPRGDEPAKAAAFPVTVCSADLPDGVREVGVADRPLPVPRARVDRIVVVGDSGCRTKGDALQDCSDPVRWPFARVASAAALHRPDLVIHVGDYHYRETPCPAGQGCAGPWGYGWDAWQADFFAPAAPLLAAAPWVMVRGNHEECSRAGQGWSRLLAPGRFAADRSCDRRADDAVGDFEAPYAVDIGADLQLLVVDSARAGNAPLRPDRPDEALAAARIEAAIGQVAALAAAPGRRSWFLSHHPVLAFAPRPDRPQQPYPGNPALQDALRKVVGEDYFPPSVQLALHGHVHNFQALDFVSPQPATLVAGNGGDSLDEVFPDPFPIDRPPAPGTRIGAITTAASFGFLVLERTPPAIADWQVRAYGVDGSLLAHCALQADRHLRCTRPPT